MSVKIIDTNILLDYPTILKEDDVVIPLSVVEELDHLKTSSNEERSKKSRIASHRLKESLDRCHIFLEKDIAKEVKTDEKLILDAKALKGTVYTNDINVQIKCQAYGVPFKEFHSEEDYYTGIETLTVSKDDDIISQIYSGEKVDYPFYENQYIFVKEPNGTLKDCLVYRNGIFNHFDSRKKGIERENDKPIYPINPEQKCLFEALNNPDSTILYAGGTFGVGKSFILNSYALSQLERGKIKKIVYVPNNSQVENTQELGIMPGEMFDKQLPYIGPLIDILGDVIEVQRYIEDSSLEIVPLATIRGRSFDEAIIIVSEAENITEDQVKLLISRVGKNTRIFFDGDVKQADKKVFKNKSGLKLLTKLRFSPKFAPLFSMVKLEKTERSLTAQAAQYLDEVQ